MKSFPILSIIIFLPLLSALYMMLFVRHNNKDTFHPKYVALLSSVLTIICSLYIWVNFNPDTEGFQFQEKHVWISHFNINYHLGIDGISLYFVLLTPVLTFICIIESFKSIENKIVEYLVCFLVMESMVIGAFCALDLVLFYLFFEAILIPMFLIIGIWGGENRVYAALKFFLYTFLGSLLFLTAIIIIYNLTGKFNLIELKETLPTLALSTQKYLWCLIFIAFAVKVPMLPFHTWLPDAHVEAPTGGSVILAGILLKLGGYGFIRFLLPLLPEASLYFSKGVCILSIVAIIYTSIVAFAQTNMKKMIAYSSIAHMGYVTLGIFIGNSLALQGAIFQMISHALVSAALFLIVGSLYERRHSKEINKYGSMKEDMPRLAGIFIFFVMASIGLPSTSGFVGEFLTLLGTAQVKLSYSLFASAGVVLGAIYMLLLYKNIMLGNPQEERKKVNDLRCEELFYYALLMFLTISIGIKPDIILNYLQAIKLC